MGLLELDRVSRHYSGGSRVALDEVSLVLEAGEMVSVWGERRSGRSTLMRVAAGIEQPDTGRVLLAGRELHTLGDALGSGVGYCRKRFRATARESVLDHLLAAQYARRVHASTALTRAWKALRRVDAEAFSALHPSELDAGEIVRVAVARALTAEPSVLVIDEPTLGIDPDERDVILRLLRSIADEGIAVLTCTSEGTGLLGADRVLSLSKGRLRGELSPELAPVTDLSRHRHTSGQL